MAIVASKGSSFTPCPAGSHVAICCDVVDIGIIKSEYQGKAKSQHKIYISWQVEELRDDKKHFVVSKRYTLSLHEKANLRKELESWRGRPFTEEEGEGFDVENLIGVPCMLSVVHAAVKGNVYANVAAIMKLPKGVPAPHVDPTYIRVMNRPKDAPGAAGGTAEGPDPAEWVMGITDDDVPF